MTAWLNLSVLPVRSEVLAEVFGDEAVVVQLRTGAYYAFDPAATASWTVVAGRAHIGPVGAVVPADDGDGQSRLLDFLRYLVQEELIELTGSLPDGPALPDGAAHRYPGIEKFTDMEDLLVLDPIHDIDLDGDGWPEVSDTGVALR
jgi:hypothetical protein